MTARARDRSDAFAGLCATRNQQHDAAAAIRTCERAASMPGRELSRAAVAVARAAAGQRRQAQAIAAQLAARYGDDPGASIALATAWLAAGDRDRALTSLEQGAERRVPQVAAVLESPYLRSLRTEPRFHAPL